MQTHRLICHPDTPAKNVSALEVMVSAVPDGIELLYALQATGRDIVRIPSLAEPLRTDDLWKTTCFELFLRRQSGTYVELNFSPSTQWAAYSFEAYRQGLTNLPIHVRPLIEPGDGNAPYLMSVWLDRSYLDAEDFRSLGLSSVIEETCGTKSYWALRHPPGKPDFHHPDCFALTLPAPGCL